MSSRWINSILAMMAVLSAVASRALADKFYVGPPDGFWSDPENWSNTADGPGGAGVPVAGEWTGFLHTDPIDRVITLDVSTSIGNLVVYRYPGGTTTIVHPDGIDFTTTQTAIGQYAGGSYYLQSGGTHTTAALNVGPSIGDYGTYALSNGTVRADGITVGNSGYGTFIQSGGDVYANNVQIARGTTLFGAGTYILNGNGASLVVAGNETISYRSHGFFIQSAGNHFVGGNLYVGATGGGYATYEMSGGSLTVQGNLLVGTGGLSSGTFVQTGGSVFVGSESAPRDLNIGSGTGIFQLSGPDAKLIVSGTANIGYNTTFTQSGGYVQVGGDFWTGKFSSISGGSIVVHGNQAFTGTFNQSGGIVNVTSTDAKHGPYARYTLSGGTYLAPVLRPYDFTWTNGALDVGTIILTGPMTITHDSGKTLRIQGLRKPQPILSSYIKLDLTNNNAIIDYDGDPQSQILDVREFLATGHLISSTADPTHRLGYADNADPLLQKSSFSDQTFPAGDFSQLLVMYTLGGDANLDGAVNLFDLTALATHWQQSDAFWTEGDFNYDGVVNSADLGILAQSWPAGGSSLSDAVIDAGLPVAAIPEPAGALLLIAGMGFGLRGRAGTIAKVRRSRR